MLGTNKAGPPWSLAMMTTVRRARGTGRPLARPCGDAGDTVAILRPLAAHGLAVGAGRSDRAGGSRKYPARGGGSIKPSL